MGNLAGPKNKCQQFGGHFQSIFCKIFHAGTFKWGGDLNGGVRFSL